MDFIRNDNAATTLTGKNLDPSCASVDEKGRVITLSAGIATDEAVIAAGLLPFDEISGDYALLYDNEESADIVILLLTNATDVVVQISFNGTTPSIFLPPQAAMVLDLGANSRHVSTSIYVADAGEAATSGAVLGTVIL